jgi:23S rRNA (cytidine1920-2'-O)/16S rRNA (cytidine1409-2'-O)-methyltransferase
MSLEHRHFNSLSNNMFKFKIDYVVADLSFISLTKLIDKLISLFSYKYKCVFLIKPQFELSPNEIKNGKPIKNTLLKKAVEKIVMYAQQNNFKVMGVVKSPIKGSKKENTEFLIYMEHN